VNQSSCIEDISRSMNERTYNSLRVKDPVFHAAIGIRSLVLTLVPVLLDLADETVFVLLSALFSLLTFGL